MTRTRTAVLLIVLLIPLLASAADINQELIKATKQGDTAAVKALLTRGADVNAKNKKGETALMGAAWYGHTTIVEALLKAGADTDVKAKNGGTALLAAAETGTKRLYF